MTTLQTNTTAYVQLFEHPSVEEMHDQLTPAQFESFVAYVFERAGYNVQRTGHSKNSIDLKLYQPGQAKPIAAVDVRRFAPNVFVNTRDVRKLKRALFFSKTPNYVVTTSDFARPAYQLAENDARIVLVNGSKFTRYIDYVLGSRYDAAAFGPIPIDIVFQGDKLNVPSSGHTKVLTVANNKGGVGKTTTTLFLASGLARAGKRVLLVDLDAQANLTGMILRKSPSAFTAKHIGHYFAHQSNLSELVLSTDFTNVDLVPAHPSLHLTDLGGAAHPALELQFAADLRSERLVLPTGAHLPYDWIIIDTPPALTQHTRAALAAAHYVLAPAVPDVMGLTGLTNMLSTLKAMQGLRGDTVKLMGCLITRRRASNPYQDFYEQQIRDLMATQQSHLMSTKIPEDLTLTRKADEIGFWEAIQKASVGTTAYQELVQEVLRHAGEN